MEMTFMVPFLLDFFIHKHKGIIQKEKKVIT